MTTQEIIGKIKLRRQSNITRSKSGLKEKLQDIRVHIVENSFSGKPDADLHNELVKQLEAVKARLKQVTAFGG